jgi:hypothetical protein
LAITENNEPSSGLVESGKDEVAVDIPVAAEAVEQSGPEVGDDQAAAVKDKLRLTLKREFAFLFI